jgi:predicted aspartyl protease
MGTIKYPIDIGSPDKRASHVMETWADSGAIYTWIPEDILLGLGHKPEYRRKFLTADGRVIERGLGRIPIRIGKEVQETLVVFGDEGSQPLLRAVTLEEFGLGVDSVNHTLIPVVANLLGFRELS